MDPLTLSTISLILAIAVLAENTIGLWRITQGIKAVQEGIKVIHEDAKTLQEG